MSAVKSGFAGATSALQPKCRDTAAHALTIVSEIAASMHALPLEAYKDLSPEIRIQFALANSLPSSLFVPKV